MHTFPTEAAAVAWLEREGFHLTASGEFWAKRGRVDPICGGHESTALWSVQRHSIAPEFGGGASFSLRFH